MIVVALTCWSVLVSLAQAQTTEGWEFQVEQVWMEAKGFDEHVGDIIQRTFVVGLVEPPRVQDNLIRDPISLNMDRRNTFRLEADYRRRGWGAGTRGWFFSTENSVAGELSSPAPVRTPESSTRVVNTVSMWKETLPPVGNDLEPGRFSPVGFDAKGELSTFSLDFFALRTLRNTDDNGIEVILGTKVGRVRTRQDQGFRQRAFALDYFARGLHLDNRISLSSTADSDLLGIGPMLGLAGRIRWRRLSIHASATESFLIGGSDQTGTFTDIDDVAFTQSPNGPRLPCTLQLAPLDCFSIRSDLEFSKSERTFVPVTELHLKLLVDVTRNISAGGTAFAAIWAGAPIPPAFTLTHAGEGPGLDWALQQRTLRFGAIGWVVNVRF